MVKDESANRMPSSNRVEMIQDLKTRGWLPTVSGTENEKIAEQKIACLSQARKAIHGIYNFP